jgi:thioredoxin-related protein
MKNFLLFFVFVASLSANGQDMKKFNLYNPTENAEKKIEEAVQLATKEGKHILIQIGGNWCIWCARFHEFIAEKEIDSFVKANYIVYHLNFSPENDNKNLLEKYKFPQRFGFPVFLILDSKGNLIHTQNSEYLEDGKSSYVKEKVIAFFKAWSPAAVNPKSYNLKPDGQ